MVWIATVVPAHPSVSTTSKLVVTSCPPTFCTVTTTWAVSPCGTERGPVMPVTATSVPGGGRGAGGGGGGPVGMLTGIHSRATAVAQSETDGCCVDKARHPTH